MILITHLSGSVFLPQLDQHQLVDPLADDDDYVKEEGDNLKKRWCPMMMIMQNLKREYSKCMHDDGEDIPEIIVASKVDGSLR